jgi:hypothetical protein
LESYGNASGDSAVRAFEISATSIVVVFRSGRTYVYDHFRPGKRDVERMKALALAGEGLGRFISDVVKTRYARRLA